LQIVSHAFWHSLCYADAPYHRPSHGAAAQAEEGAEAMSIKTLDEKFQHELADIYDAEHQFLDAQQQMLKKANDDTVKTLLTEHISQTEQQIKNLEQVFEALGEKPKREKCAGAAGIVSEGQKLLKEVEGPALIDLAIAGAASKVEHYEISSYRGLIEGAKLMGNKDVERLLQENLKQEEQTAQKVEKNTPALLKQAMSMQEQERGR
jgi:ferritin-like metal-binding protein YciE